MTAVWVDTDFGFDDLWALLLLRHLEFDVAGISLVAGNARIEQVEANALGASMAYRIPWPLWSGSSKPVKRPQETAERVLGPTGMQSRGKSLPKVEGKVAPGGIEAMANWLKCGALSEARTILALGPLTNIAFLIQKTPAAAKRISRLVWMGGSKGRGNQSKAAEFNALADPEALDIVARSGVAFDIVDLTFCRAVLFGENDIPETDSLTVDLVGGYLDIALTRGRSRMAIYDPLAALAVAQPSRIHFEPQRLHVVTESGQEYGATHFTPVAESAIRLASLPDAALAADCLSAISREALNLDG